jgi:plasmid stabilization system protein ParE
MADFDISIQTKALEDLRFILEYYFEISEQLKKNFFNQFEIKSEAIKSNPEIFQTKYKNFRTAKIGKFPYLIHYFIDYKTNTIQILAILHTSRNPEIWT